MKFNEVVCTIEEFIYSSKWITYINPQYHERFIKTYGVIKTHIGQIENDEKQLLEHNIQEIEESLNVLMDLIFEIPIDNLLSNFINAWIQLILNWNNNVNKDINIEKKCTHIKRLLNNHFTMLEAFEALKGITEKSKKLQNWLPPSFQLSEHYLKTLEE